MVERGHINNLIIRAINAACDAKLTQGERKPSELLGILVDPSLPKGIKLRAGLNLTGSIFPGFEESSVNFFVIPVNCQ